MRLAGVECVVAEDFERIHRQNLVGMGALPVQFEAGTTRKTLNIDGTEVFDIEGEVSSGGEMTLVIHRQDGTVDNVPVICRLDTQDEVEMYNAGGMLQRFAKEFIAGEVG